MWEGEAGNPYGGISHGPSSVSRAEHRAGVQVGRRHSKVFVKMPTQTSLPKACQSGQKLFVPFNALGGRNEINRKELKKPGGTHSRFISVVCVFII